MKRLPLILASFLTVFFLSASIWLYSKPHTAPTAYRMLSTAAELDELLARKGSSPLLVDLRDSTDFEAAHIANFSNFAFDDGGKRLETWINPFNRDKQVILICYAGNRSARAFEKLVLMGFTNIADFSPGFASYALEKGTGFTPETGSCNCPK